VIPPSIVALSGAGSQLRGDVSEARFRVVAPVATAVLSDRPVLRWTALASDAAYVVRLHDETTGAMISSPPVRSVEWTPDAPLTRSDTYVWQVESSNQGQEYTAPAPPAPPATFIVLDAATAARLADAPASHLVRGILYADAGALDDAQREFSALSAQNPTSDVVHDFLNQLVRARALKPANQR